MDIIHAAAFVVSLLPYAPLAIFLFFFGPMLVGASIMVLQMHYSALAEYSGRSSENLPDIDDNHDLKSIFHLPNMIVDGFNWFNKAEKLCPSDKPIRWYLLLVLWFCIGISITFDLFDLYYFLLPDFDDKGQEWIEALVALISHVLVLFHIIALFICFKISFWLTTHLFNFAFFIPERIRNRTSPIFMLLINIVTIACVLYYAIWFLPLEPEQWQIFAIGVVVVAMFYLLYLGKWTKYLGLGGFILIALFTIYSDTDLYITKVQPESTIGKSLFLRASLRVYGKDTIEPNWKQRLQSDYFKRDYTSALITQIRGKKGGNTQGNKKPFQELRSVAPIRSSKMTIEKYLKQAGLKFESIVAPIRERILINRIANKKAEEGISKLSEAEVRVLNKYIDNIKKQPYPDTVQPVNKKPSNGKFANKTYKLPKGLEGKYPNGVRFDKEGFPIFSPYALRFDKNGFPILKPSTRNTPDENRYVTITMTGKYPKDFAAADKKAGINEAFRKKHKLTWHHHQNMGRMELIPKSLHDNVKHTGGSAVFRKKFGWGYEKTNNN